MLAQLPARERIFLYLGGVALVGGLVVFGSRGSARGPAQAQVPTQYSDKPVIPVRTAEEKSLVVDVAGDVAKPGVERLPPDSRVEDAIKSAGGAGADADLTQLNLAAKLSDGTQLYVPHKNPAKNEQPVDTMYQGGPAAPNAYSSHPAAHAGSGSGGKHPSAPVSLSTASESQLESLPGVGPSTAQKIMEYRQEHGGFSTVEEIQAVKGIGPKKFAKMKPFLKP